MNEIEPTICVCLATFQRPEGLSDTLAGIAKQVLDAKVASRLVVVVVDNDPTRSAESTVDAAREQHGLRIIYSVQQRRGVVHARNAGVAAALDAGADFVAFIDDDESPHPEWLSQLLSTQRATGAPIVGGPVIEVLGDHLPAWYRASGFSMPPNRGEGSAAPYAACGNSLFSAGLLASIDGPFDERFNVSGGEDVFLSLTLAKAGASIVWSPRALVDTIVPSDRARLRHVVRRHYIGAANFTRAERMVDGRRNERVLTGVGRVVVGSFRAVVGGLRLSRHRVAIGIVDAAEGLGVLAGALGRGEGRSWWTS